jgi:hypothetical protein
MQTVRVQMCLQAESDKALKNSHGEKKHLCEEMFTKKSSLLRHRKKHVGKSIVDKKYGNKFIHGINIILIIAIFIYWWHN